MQLSTLLTFAGSNLISAVYLDYAVTDASCSQCPVLLDTSSDIYYNLRLSYNIRIDRLKSESVERNITNLIPIPEWLC